jgi:folate-binding protein YgfZ
VSAVEQAAAVRRTAGLFRLSRRGLLSVEGKDRLRWLDGMITNDVAALEAGSQHSGCYAALLTRKGRIVADLHVLLRPAAYWLETSAEAVEPVRATLERFIVADDVVLRDASAELERLALEGPAAPAILEGALGAPLALAPEACAEVELDGVKLLVAAFGWSGAAGYQLLAPAGTADAITASLERVGAAHGLLRAGEEALEILRIEAGIPRLGSELDEDVLPAEARLERAISTTKGCYTGQEIVARLASRGQVNHLLVGLRCAGERPPPVGAELHAEGRRVGEVTSACLSPAAGVIALGYLRRPLAAPGTRVELEGGEALVSELPFSDTGCA